MSQPLVLLPGLMTDARIWGAQIEALSSDFTLILPSFGLSQSVEEIAQRILPDMPPQFSVVGHSLGAAVAMEMLRRAPDRIRRIAIMSAGCLSEPPAVAAEREARMTRARAGRLDAAMAEEYPPSCLAPGPMDDAVADFLYSMAEELGTDRYLLQSKAMQRRPDQQRTIRQARIPGLVVAGRQDSLVPPQRQQFLADLMPNATILETEAGHFPCIETPTEVTLALKTWMQLETNPLLLS